jgi:hypothetical protein
MLASHRCDDAWGSVLARDGDTQGVMRILDGRCFAFVAFDVGFEIELAQVMRLLDAGRAPEVRPRRPAPPSVRYPEPPVEVALADHRLPDGATATVIARIFDFGVVSLCFTLPLPATLEALPAQGRYLAEQSDLAPAAEARLAHLLERIRPAVARFAVSEIREDYFIFQMTALEGAPTAAALLAAAGPWLAGTLALEPGPLDPGYVSQLLAHGVSYNPTDLVLCDWNAALIYDQQYDDTLAVLEFINVQLLELRFQDSRLERALEGFTGVPRRGTGIGAFLNPYRRPVQQLAELTIESTLLSERAINAMKLLGDDYLARVARLAAERLHLADWVATVRRKQETVATLFQTLNDRLAATRGEALELAIVVLIVVEILLFLGG